jgi:hypothetical protein
MNRRIHFSFALVLILLSLYAGSVWSASVQYMVDGSFQTLGSNPVKSAWVLPAQGRVQSNAGRQADATREPDYAVAITSVNDFGSELIQPIQPLVAGREYVLTAWARAERPGLQARIGVRMSDVFPSLYRGLTGDGWEQISLKFVATEGKGEIVLANSVGGTVWWDDISIQESRTAAEKVAAEWEASLKEGKPLYTGLVVNALGTTLERGMSPRIYDVSGKLIFDGKGATFDQLISTGIVAYVRTLEEATTHPRLAVSEEYPMRLPLIVDAQGVSGVPRTSVIIGEEAARRVRAATDQYDFLGRFAVVFVID